MFARIALVATIVLASDRVAADSSHRIGYSGFGSVRIGMPLWRLVVALGEHVTVESVEGGCTTVYSATSTDLTYMVVDDVLARVEVRTPELSTLSGVKVGDTEEEVFAAYGARVAVSDHEYQEGHYLTVYSSDRRSAVVFDTDGTRIRSFRIGRLPETLHVEGCS